jgi:hypothetical protein
MAHTYGDNASVLFLELTATDALAAAILPVISLLCPRETLVLSAAEDSLKLTTKTSHNLKCPLAAASCSFNHDPENSDI